MADHPLIPKPLKFKVAIKRVKSTYGCTEEEAREAIYRAGLPVVRWRYLEEEPQERERLSSDVAEATDPHALKPPPSLYRPRGVDAIDARAFDAAFPETISSDRSSPASSGLPSGIRKSSEEDATRSPKLSTAITPAYEQFSTDILAEKGRYSSREEDTEWAREKGYPIKYVLGNVRGVPQVSS